MVRIPRTPKRTVETPFPEIPLLLLQVLFDPPQKVVTSAMEDAPSIEPVTQTGKKPRMPRVPRQKSPSRPRIKDIRRR